MSIAPRMKSLFGRALFAASCVLCSQSSVQAAEGASIGVIAAAGDTTARPRWIVGTQLAPPFVTRGDDGTYGGTAIDLWRAMGDILGIESEFRSFDYDRAGLMRALERGEIDIAVANLTVSVDAERRIDFTHSFLRAELGIVTRREPSAGRLDDLRNINLAQIALAVIGLLLLLATVGALVWAVERRRNAEQFDPHPALGLADGLWWAAVTMTTTGYGDKAPRTLAGRTIALVWMFSSIFLTALFSAALASALVVGQLKTRVNGPQDLPKAKVVTVADSFAASWLRSQGIAAYSLPYVIQALNAVQRAEADAVVFERVVLDHLVSDQRNRGLVLLAQGIGAFEYAFALPEASPRREAVNRALLQVTNSSQWITARGSTTRLVTQARPRAPGAASP